MKKILCLLIVLTMVCALAGCRSAGSSAEAEKESESKEEEENESIEYNTKLYEEDEEEESEEQEEESEETETITLNQTVMDNEYCTIIITSIVPDGNYQLNLKIINKTDISLDITQEDIIMDNLCMYSTFDLTVSAGKTIEETHMTIRRNESAAEEELENYRYTDMQVTFNVNPEDEGGSVNRLASETVHIYPYGEENASAYEREAQDTDKVICDNDNFSIIILNCDEYSEAEVYLVNKTDAELDFIPEDGWVNGEECSPYPSLYAVPAGCSDYATIYWTDSKLEEIGIDSDEKDEEIEKLEVRFTVCNDSTGEYILDETYTIYP